MSGPHLLGALCQPGHTLRIPSYPEITGSSIEFASLAARCLWAKYCEGCPEASMIR